MRRDAKRPRRLSGVAFAGQACPWRFDGAHRGGYGGGIAPARIAGNDLKWAT